jgi:hypothetical protein
MLNAEVDSAPDLKWPNSGTLFLDSYLICLLRRWHGIMPSVFTGCRVSIAMAVLKNLFLYSMQLIIGT